VSIVREFKLTEAQKNLICDNPTCQVKVIEKGQTYYKHNSSKIWIKLHVACYTDNAFDGLREIFKSLDENRKRLTK
jgi:hypothetical protein